VIDTLRYYVLKVFIAIAFICFAISELRRRRRKPVTASESENQREVPQWVYVVIGYADALTPAIWATFETREKAERYPGPRMLELAPRVVVEYARTAQNVTFNIKATANAIYNAGAGQGMARSAIEEILIRHLNAQAITAPAESSERRCGECGHINFNAVIGECDEPSDSDDKMFCGCKCVFPATGTGEGGRQREGDK
jgi:hypothetical protein